MRTNEPTDMPFMPDPSALDITNEKFQELADTTVEMVKKVAFENCKSLMPVVFIHHRRFVEDNMLSDIEFSVIGLDCDMSDAKQKQEILKQSGRKIFEERLLPVAVFMASEAWMASNLKDGMMPRDDPDRKEVIMIAGTTISADCKIGVTIPFSRDKEDYMHQDGETIITRELETFLLNNFFHGYFEKMILKYGTKLEGGFERKFRT